VIVAARVYGVNSIARLRAACFGGVFGVEAENAARLSKNFGFDGHLHLHASLILSTMFKLSHYDAMQPDLPHNAVDP